MTLALRPITQRACFAYIGEHHRHHKPPRGALWCHAVHRAGQVCGVAVVGRPVARMLQDGLTCEVTRLCTDGTRNACSILYAAARRAAQAIGYVRGLTYILESEDGGSLRASGWQPLWQTAGGSWSRESRPRDDKAPTCAKQAWGWGEWHD